MTGSSTKKLPFPSSVWQMLRSFQLKIFRTCYCRPWKQVETEASCSFHELKVIECWGHHALDWEMIHVLVRTAIQLELSLRCVGKKWNQQMCLPLSQWYELILKMILRNEQCQHQLLVLRYVQYILVAKSPMRVIIARLSFLLGTNCFLLPKKNNFTCCLTHLFHSI